MEIHKALNKEQKDDTLEGEELKRLAAQYEQECKRLNEIRLQEAKQLMSDNIRQIQDVERMREIQQQQEEVIISELFNENKSDQPNSQSDLSFFYD